MFIGTPLSKRPSKRFLGRLADLKDRASLPPPPWPWEEEYSIFTLHVVNPETGKKIMTVQQRIEVELRQTGERRATHNSA